MAIGTAEHKQKRSEAACRADTSEVDREHVQKYKELINRCHEQLMAAAGEDLQAALKQEQEAWENYVQPLMDMQLNYYMEYFTGSSSTPLAYSRFEYDIYKQRALLFQEICENITSIADIRKQYEQAMQQE